MTINNLINEAYRRLIESSSDDFKACVVAGVPLEFSSEATPEGMKITATTAVPVAVVRTGDSTTVFVGRPKE